MKKDEIGVTQEVSRRKFIKTAAATAGVTGMPFFFVKAHAESDPKVLRMYQYDGNLG